MAQNLYNYNLWPNFTKAELICQHTGKENPNIQEFSDLMHSVQLLRRLVGVPFKVTSAYRDPSHPNEAWKERVGMHTLAAIDFQVPVEYAHEVIKKAFELGFTGIGVNLKGDTRYRFIHLDQRPAHRARVWSY